METKLLQLAMNNLIDEVDKIKLQLYQALHEIDLLKKSNYVSNSSEKLSPIESDELMDLKEVQSKLGICYNSLNKLVKKGILKPIRINQRRVRFTRLSVITYIQSLA